MHSSRAMTSVPCLVRLRGAYTQFTEAERRVADYLLTEPHATLRSSMIEVAQASAAGSGTIARMCVKVGYSGFAEMKIALAAQLLNPEYYSEDSLQQSDDISTAIEKVMRSGAQSLLSTARLLSATALEDAARAMIRARRLDIYSEGVFSGVIAQHAHARLLLVDLPCSLTTVPWQIPVAANQLRSDDVALAISHSGITDSIVNAARNARDAGATTICITGRPHSPLAQISEIALLGASADTSEWGHAAVARLPLYALVEALYAVISLLKYRDQTEASLPPAT